MSDNGLNYWKRLYDSLSQANQELEKKVGHMQAVINHLNTQLANAQKAVDINKNLLRQVNEEHNKKELELISFMNKLKDKLREFGYGDFNQLGD